MKWKPKYEVGDEVCVVLPKVSSLPTQSKFGFGAKGIVMGVARGFYTIKLTKIFFDDYFSNKPAIGQAYSYHFPLVEDADERLGKILHNDEPVKVVFT